MPSRSRSYSVSDTESTPSNVATRGISPSPKKPAHRRSEAKIEYCIQTCFAPTLTFLRSGGEKSTCAIAPGANLRPAWLLTSLPHAAYFAEAAVSLQTAVRNQPVELGANVKFVTFQSSGAAHVGALAANGTALVDLTEAGLAASMLDLIERFDSLRERIKTAVAAQPARPFVHDDLLAPIPRPAATSSASARTTTSMPPSSAERLRQQRRRTASDVPEAPDRLHQAAFQRVIGPGDEHPSAPASATVVDYEAELAVVIGKGGRGIREGRRL